MRAHVPSIPAGFCLLAAGLLLAGCIDRPPDADYFGDNDGDGLPNFEEANRGTDPEVSDTDSDALSDWDEIYRYYTDPLDPDSDDDSLWDSVDPAPLDPENDEDGDGYLDQYDFWPYKNLSHWLRIDWNLTSESNLQFDFRLGADIIFGKTLSGNETDFVIIDYDWPDNRQSQNYSVLFDAEATYWGSIAQGEVHWDYVDDDINLHLSVSFTENG